MINQNPITVQDKVILITGAAGLIGKEISFTLLKNNAKVILADINTSSFVKIKQELVDICEEKDYLLRELDIISIKSISTFIKCIIDKYGKIDVLINKAAIDAKFDNSDNSQINENRFENYPLESLKKSIDVNILGTIQITHQICKIMLKHGFGNIINVASAYSLVAPNHALYNSDDGKPHKFKHIDYVATKSVIPNLTKYLATLYGKEGTRCNAIIPQGIINNTDSKLQKTIFNLSPIVRMYDKGELAGVFILLCSDASSYMTGSTIVIDGGWKSW